MFAFDLAEAMRLVIGGFIGILSIAVISYLVLYFSTK